VSESYRHTQIGWTLIVIVGAAAVAEIVIAAAVAPESTLALALAGAVAAVLAVVLVLFGTLTVMVDRTVLRLAFGVDLLRREVLLAEVVAARKVRNPWLAGWGVRDIPGGRLYTVGGFDAVELELDSGRVVRIGTDEPDALLAAVQLALPRGREVVTP
jgi:hypothetical protein